MNLVHISGKLYSDEFGRIWELVVPGHYEMISNPRVDSKRQLNPDNVRGY